MAAVTEPRLVRGLLMGVALAFLAIFLVVPLVAVFWSALRDGVGHYLDTIRHRETLAAIRLTLITAAIAVPLNVAFGLCAAWAIARFRFRGKNLLMALIDLPFGISPVIAGMVFVLLFGRQGLLGPAVLAHGIHIVFALPGIVLSTMFVTLPYVAREVTPLMQAQGSEPEEAALTLGAGGFEIFRRITLPRIKWGLLYGVVLCSARAMGEFGAVSVISGHIRGKTTTMPLQVEVLYNDYDLAGAFAVASLLTLLALATLAVKTVVEWRSGA